MEGRTQPHDQHNESVMNVTNCHRRWRCWNTTLPQVLHCHTILHNSTGTLHTPNTHPTHTTRQTRRRKAKSPLTVKHNDRGKPDNELPCRQSQALTPSQRVSPQLHGHKLIHLTHHTRSTTTNNNKYFNYNSQLGGERHTRLHTAHKTNHGTRAYLD